MFAPPFRDPFNYNFHPVHRRPRRRSRSARSCRRASSRKASRAYVSAAGASYSTWWNGGLRTTAYFHNQIGILTETIGNPTPTQIPFSRRASPCRTRTAGWPITPQQVWQFRQSIDYSITANRAVLDFASRYRETILFRIYQMGKDNIKWGNEDHWTHHAAQAREDHGGDLRRPGAGCRRRRRRRRRGGGGGGGGRGGGAPACPQLYAALTAKEHRDPRGFILPSDSPDFGTSVRFVNTLIKSGISDASRDGGVHRRRQAVPGQFARSSRAARRSVRT